MSVPVEDIIDAPIDTVRCLLSSIQIPVDNLSDQLCRLSLGDVFVDRGLFNVSDVKLLKDEQFRSVVALEDSELVKLLPSDVVANETYRSDAIFKIYSSKSDILYGRIMYNKTHKNVKTIVYCDEDRVSELADKLSSYKHILVKSALPTHKEIDDSIIVTFNINNVNDYILKYGSYCKILVIAPKYSEYSESFTITAYTVNDAIEYISTPINESVKLLVYFISGSNGLQMLGEHIGLRSWKLLYVINEVYPTYADYIQIYPIISKEGVNLQYKDHKTYYIKCFIKNLVDANTNKIIHKDMLFELMKSNFDDYYTFMPETMNITELPNFDDWKYGTAIVKPSGFGAGSGVGINVVTNKEEYDKAVQSIIDHNEEVRDKAQKVQEKYRDERRLEDRTWTAIVSKYIDNPLLFEGKKFHFRTLIVITSWGKSFIYPEHFVYTAKLPYQQADYSKKDIHDTHFSSTDKDISFPRDFYGSYSDEDVTTIDNSLSNVLNRVIQMMRGKVVSYEESKLSYEILGTDCMCDTNLNCWLIEVNTMPGLGTISSREDDRKFADWKYKTVIQPIQEIISSIRIVKMEDSTPDMRSSLLQITKNIQIMAYVDEGKLWYESDIENKYNESIKNAHLDDIKRSAFGWIVMDDDDVIGYVEIKKTPKYQGRFEILLVLDDISGAGENVVNVCVREFKSRMSDNDIHLYSIVDITTRELVKLFEDSLKWNKIQYNLIIDGKNCNVYTDDTVNIKSEPNTYRGRGKRGRGKRGRK